MMRANKRLRIPQLSCVGKTGALGVGDIGESDSGQVPERLATDLRAPCYRHPRTSAQEATAAYPPRLIAPPQRRVQADFVFGQAGLGIMVASRTAARPRGAPG